MVDRKQVIIFGNGAIDNVAENTSIESKGKNILVTQNGQEPRKIALVDGPFASGKKHSTRDLEGHIAAFEVDPVAGGGAHNSAQALSRLRNGVVSYGIKYFDPSNPHQKIKWSLAEEDVETIFGYHRDIPQRLVISEGSENLNLGGMPLQRIDNPNGEFLDLLVKNVAKDETVGVLVTSAKDPVIVEQIVRYGKKADKKFYFVPTDSLEADFVREQMYGKGDVVISWNDLLKFNSLDYRAPDKEKFVKSYAAALEEREKFGKQFNWYVTMGDLGVIVFNKENPDEKEHVSYVGINRKEVRANVGAQISRRLGSTNSAGDKFTAGVIHHSLVEPPGYDDAASIAQQASYVAIKGIGYGGKLRSDYFQTTQITGDLITRIEQEGLCALNQNI